MATEPGAVLEDSSYDNIDNSLENQPQKDVSLISNNIKVLRKCMFMKNIKFRWVGRKENS